jgi:hypothetical protein
LSQELLRHRDWRTAAHRYARQRDRYFRTVITAESWLTELQLESGPAAAERRAHVMRAWKADPLRSTGLDLPGRGPTLDVSESARRWVFAEDIPRGAAPSARQPAPEVTPGEAFLDAIGRRDFSAIESLIADDARVRALLPGGPVELAGSAGAGAAFRRWFGDVEEFELLDTELGSVADRLRMSWRCRIRWAGEDFARMIEQQAYAKVVDGRIAVIDMLCSGFRPSLEQAAQEAA